MIHAYFLVFKIELKKQNTYFEEGRITTTYFKRNFNFCSFHGQFKVILNNKPNLEVK